MGNLPGGYFPYSLSATSQMNKFNGAWAIVPAMSCAIQMTNVTGTALDFPVLLVSLIKRVCPFISSVSSDVASFLAFDMAFHEIYEKKAALRHPGRTYPTNKGFSAGTGVPIMDSPIHLHY